LSRELARPRIAAEEEHDRLAAEATREVALEVLRQAGLALARQEHDRAASEARAGQPRAEDARKRVRRLDQAIELWHRDLVQIAQGSMRGADVPAEGDVIRREQGRACGARARHLAGHVACALR